MSITNGILSTSKESKKVRKEIDHWKKLRNSRKCTEFSEMSYWEVVSVNTAL